MTIHELQQVIWVSTPLGDGVVVTITDYGPHHNAVFMVMLEDGRFRFFDTNQCTACRNDTLGINAPRP